MKKFTVLVDMLNKAAPKKERVIKELNGRLNDQIHASITYMIQAHICGGWGYKRLANLIKEQAIGEMHHADALIERIVYFDETPKIDIPEFSPGASVVDIFKEIERLETEAVARYNRSAQISEQEGDQVSRAMFTSFAQDEERHLDWVLAQQDQIEQMGLRNYLAEQAEPISD